MAHSATGGGHGAATLPALIVKYSEPLSNGWQICVVAPRSALVQNFAILLPNTAQEAALHLAERLQETLHHAECPCGQTSPTLSIGISSYSDADADADVTAEAGVRVPDAASLMRAADVAMYRAKQRGRNQISCATAEEELAE